MKVIIELIAAGIAMGILDFFWLGKIAKKLYYDELGSLLLKKPNMVPAILFYIIYIVGVVVFVVNPSVNAQSWIMAISKGALFGFVAYATYDLTNLATVKGFSQKIVVIDLIWGSVLTAVISLAAYAAALLVS